MSAAGFAAGATPAFGAAAAAGAAPAFGAAAAAGAAPAFGAAAAAPSAGAPGEPAGKTLPPFFTPTAPPFLPVVRVLCPRTFNPYV